MYELREQSTYRHWSFVDANTPQRPKPSYRNPSARATDEGAEFDELCTRAPSSDAGPSPRRTLTRSALVHKSLLRLGTVQPSGRELSRTQVATTSSKHRTIDRRPSSKYMRSATRNQPMAIVVSAAGFERRHVRAAPLLERSGQIPPELLGAERLDPVVHVRTQDSANLPEQPPVVALFAQFAQDRVQAHEQPLVGGSPADALKRNLPPDDEVVEEDRLLRREVIEDRATADVRGRRDLVNRRLREPLPLEQLERGVGDTCSRGGRVPSAF